jgi:hypothetical protein
MHSKTEITASMTRLANTLYMSGKERGRDDYPINKQQDDKTQYVEETYVANLATQALFLAKRSARVYKRAHLFTNEERALRQPIVSHAQPITT